MGECFQLENSPLTIFLKKDSPATPILKIIYLAILLKYSLVSGSVQ